MRECVRELKRERESERWQVHICPYELKTKNLLYGKKFLMDFHNYIQLLFRCCFSVVVAAVAAVIFSRIEFYIFLSE